MTILGIGGILGEAAAAILKDGSLVAAVEEVKLSRGQRRGSLPLRSIETCLGLAKARAEEVDCVAIVRPLSTSAATPFHLQLRAHFPGSRIVLVEHHTAHAASAYYPSGFDSATVLTLDRRGDFRCGARWQATGSRLALERESLYPDSLGDLYGRVTELLGFRSGAEEHKVQWMSAWGDDRFRDLFLEILRIHDDGWPRVDRSFIDAERMTHGGFSAKFFSRIGVADGADIPETIRASIAAGVQQAVEAAVIGMAGEAERLCLAGGLGLNGLLVAALERCGHFKSVFVQPVAGNAGTAVGAVVDTWHNVYRQTDRVGMGNLCLGPDFDAEEIKKVLENCKLRFRYLLTAEELIDAAVGQLNDHRIIAWMHGRMEFGARALGNRSILASPQDPFSTENLNAFIKHREPFRKFAASVPAELATEYFEVGQNARFLATVGSVRPSYRQQFESAIFGRDWIRVHTVSKDDNPLYWRLLHAMGKATGLPVLYNTSFNLFGEPLVCTPRDAVRSFYSSGIDAMFVGHFHLEK